MDGLPKCEGFYAICNHMPDERPALRVGGTVRTPTRGWTAELVAYEGRPSPNPLLLQLTLKVTTPSGSAAEVVTPLDVEFQIGEPPFEYTQVEFYLDGPEGIELPEPVQVDHPSLAAWSDQASAAGQIRR